MKMGSIRKVLASCIVLLLLAVPVIAQEDGDDEGIDSGTIIDVLNTLTVNQTPDYVTRYDDVPQSRTEDGAFVLGNPDAEVVIVEFADFMCPHCQAYEPTIQQLITEHVLTGDIRLEYRMFPIVNPNLSPLTAQLAECAGEQGNFWGAHDYIFELSSSQRVDMDVVNNVVDTLALDMEAMESCLATADQFLTDSELGNSLGVTGTPSILLSVGEVGPNWVVANGEPLRGALPYEVLELIIQAALNGEFQSN
ncbi:MAG: thioredoxin domain-containing protein [Aggregatilineales bacterium]